MPQKQKKRIFILIGCFTFFLANFLIFKPFIFGNDGNGATALLISPSDFQNFIFKKPFLYNQAESISERLFKREVEQQAKLYPKHFFLERAKTDQKKSKKKQIALTFDDSPDDWYCPQVLRILEEHQVKATFFLIANRLKKYNQNAKDIKKKGHLIANHSYSHRKFTLMTAEQMLYDIDSAEVAFKQELGLSPTFFRPPYGMMTDEQVAVLTARNYKIMNWSIDTYDWDNKRNTPLELFTRVEAHAHDGAIVLLHSSGKDRENTIQALPNIIKSLKSRGFEFVRLDEWF